MDVDKILSHPRFQKFSNGMTRDSLKRLIDASEKKYFQVVQFNSGRWKIKALHGHSVPVSNILCCLMAHNY